MKKYDKNSPLKLYVSELMRYSNPDSYYITVAIQASCQTQIIFNIPPTKKQRHNLVRLAQIKLENYLYEQLKKSLLIDNEEKLKEIK